MADEVPAVQARRQWLIRLPLMLGALALLAGSQPLGYLLVWRYLPGQWIAVFPESFAMALCCVVAGLTASVAGAILAAVRLRHHAERTPDNSVGAFAALVMAGMGAGSGLCWLVFMASCRAG